MKNFLVFYKIYRNDDDEVSLYSFILKSLSIVNAVYDADYVFSQLSDDYNYRVIEVRELA